MQSSIRRPLVQSIRRINSSRWIDRHVRDPFVKKSVAEQARSRSAYKLQEIDQKHKLLASPQCVIDLGASPGGWSLYVGAFVTGAGCVGGTRAVAVFLMPFVCACMNAQQDTPKRAQSSRWTCLKWSRLQACSLCKETSPRTACRNSCAS